MGLESNSVEHSEKPFDVPNSKTNTYVTQEQDGSTSHMLLDHSKASLKSSSKNNLNVPRPHSRTRSRSPDNVSLISAEDFSELRRVGSNFSTVSATNDDNDHSTPRWKRRIQAAWRRNLGLVLVLSAQVFAQLMNATTRMLENDVDSMDPFQILFARMSITTTLSMLYMWYNKTPHFPLGAPEVRWLLVARGLGGFFGVFGLYWSLIYLDLSDATVITFIAPFISCWICSYLCHEPFTRIEQLGGAVSLVGVVLIARPSSIFSSGGDPVDNPSEVSSPSNSTEATITSRAAADPIPEATPSQRLQAVGMAMIGVLGATVAYVTIRWIGKRAHPLISVNYFAFWCTIVSFIALAFVPSVPFVLPTTTRQWTLLIFIGVSGFVMQFLLTAGLRYEKSSRATNMVYCQMLFALLFDHLIWGVVPTVTSMIGSSLILGSAIVVAVQKETAKKDVKPSDAINDEERGLVDGNENNDAEENEERGRNTGQDDMNGIRSN